MGEIVDLVADRSEAGSPAVAGSTCARDGGSLSPRPIEFPVEGLERRGRAAAADGRRRPPGDRRRRAGPRDPPLHDRPRSLRRRGGPPLAADGDGRPRRRDRPADADRRRRGPTAARRGRAARARPRDAAAARPATGSPRDARGRGVATRGAARCSAATRFDELEREADRALDRARTTPPRCGSPRRSASPAKACCARSCRSAASAETCSCTRCLPEDGSCGALGNRRLAHCTRTLR